MSESAQPSHRVLARNAALNAAGQLLPLLLALPILPYVLRTIGTERFAVLTLAWTMIGHFGFLDLGLGRAVTRVVAGLLGAGQGDKVSRVVWSSLAIQGLLGITGAVGIIAISGPLAHDILRIHDPVFLAETQRTIVIIALGLPLVLASGTVSGVLEAYQRFDFVNLVRVPANCSILALTALGVMLGWSLPGIVLVNVVARASALLCFAVLALRVHGSLPPVRPHGPTLRQLLGFGGWVTVSLVAGPVLAYAERLLIGGLRSLSELAYYAVAYEIAVRTTLLPVAVALTLFPAFSFAQRTGGSIAELFRRSVRLLFLLQWPLLVVLWLFPVEILTVWMNADVAAAGAAALRLLALSFFFSGFAHIALAGVQGLGRPDLKAKLDFVEVPLCVVMAALLIVPFGAAGAAAARLIVALFDTVLLFFFAWRLDAPSPVEFATLRRRPGASVAVALLVSLTGVSVLAPVSVRVITAILVVFVLGAVLWKRALEPGDRAAVLGLFARSRLKEAV